MTEPNALPLYQCHKRVRAARIVHVKPTPDGVIDLDLAYEGPANHLHFPTVTVQAAWYAKHQPMAGGYLVQYADGYLSYSPAKAFDEGYTSIKPDEPDTEEAPPETPQTSGMDFGQALTALRQGKRVARSGWNGKGLWLELQVPDQHSKMTLPYIYINYPEDATNTPGARVPWLASQTDMLAVDWLIV